MFEESQVQGQGYLENKFSHWQLGDIDQSPDEAAFDAEDLPVVVFITSHLQPFMGDIFLVTFSWYYILTDWNGL